MNSLRKLAKQTAIYGMSSIIGRFLNYLLVPLYTAKFATNEYGVVTEFYAYAGFLMVVLTYGLETGLFRFLSKETNKSKVYSTALLSIFSTSALFILLFTLFSKPLAVAMKYPDHVEYLLFFILILGFDAITAIPFAKLRADERPVKFAAVKLLNIATNIGFNLFFILLCKGAYESGASNWLAAIYSPHVGVGYIFIANLIASSLTLLVFIPEIKNIKAGFDPVLWRKMINYSLPLVLVGLAGIVNEMLDRTLLKYLLPYDNFKNLQLLGVYGACYKLAMLMTLFVQAFRYAADPFFFARAHHSDSKEIYARVLKYFTIAGCFIGLTVTLYLDIFKYFLQNEAYRVGLPVVPILLLANLFLGIYINLSVWYKLTDKTLLGGYVALLGAGITILLNVLWIPKFGYTGSAWATLICYFSMALVSYILGKKHFPVHYEIGKITFFIILAVVVYLLNKVCIEHLSFDNPTSKLLFSTVFLVFYGIVIWTVEKIHHRKKLRVS